MSQLKKNILISVPANNPRYVMYLPTIWANLKSFADKSELLRDQCVWLDPIIDKHLPEKLMEPYGDTEIHVLGLSCYSWNTKTNMLLAQYVRERNPDCIIVAGGPHIDFRNRDVFVDYPWIDCVVQKDGEVPFKQILEQVVHGERDLSCVPGLVVRGPDDGPHHVETAPPELPLNLSESSPWLENADYFEDMIQRIRAEDPNRYVGIPWEIDRGCPYQCVFCDWGSNTGSSIRSIPLERVRAEVDWVSRNKIEVCFLTVANFGIDKRDEEILDYLIAAKAKHGFPNQFIWNNAKMNVDRVVGMNTRAYKSGLISNHILSVQHLDQEVLMTMNRAPVSRKRLLSVVDEIKATGIPCVAQLIFGTPNDTPEKFLGSITGLMEMGIHDEYVAYPFDVLPNSIAGQPEFQKKWKVETVTRIGAVNKRDPNLPVQDFSTIIVATSSFSRADFVEMYVHGRLIIALHNNGFTQLLSRYLHRSRGVSYEEFYDLLLSKMFCEGTDLWQKIYRHCYDHIKDFVSEDGVDMVEAVPIEEMPSFDYYVNIEEYFHFKFAYYVDEFYAALRHVLCDAFGSWPELESLLTYSRNMIIDPSYDRQIGRRVCSAYDWDGYFLEDSDKLQEPDPAQIDVQLNHRVSGSRAQFQLDWVERSNSEADALEHWTRRIVGKHYERVERGYFKSLTGATSIERFSSRLERQA